MADITYQDVQQAIQSGIQRLDGDMQRLTNDIANISRNIQPLSEIRRDIQELQSQVQRHDPRSEISMQQIQRDLQDLKTRFETVERFCREMSEYFRAKASAEREDTEYRTPAG